MHHGFPRCLHLPALPATDPRVTPSLVSFSASSAPVRVAPYLALPVAPADTDFRVSPDPASSGFAGNRSSSYPESLVLRCLQCLSSRFPSNSAPPAAPPGVAAGFPTGFTFRLGLRFNVPGYPGFSPPWRRLMDYRVSSVLAPSGSAVPASSGFPESCIYGLVNDVSRSSRTLHPRFSPRMNLRIQSGYALSVPRLWMHLFNLIHAFHLAVNCRLQLHSASSVGMGAHLQFPTGSSTGEELRPAETVEASAKSE